MNTLSSRNLVRETLVQRTNDGSLTSFLKEKVFDNLRGLAKGICEKFNFFSNDKPQTNLAMKALRSLEASGTVTLPDYVDVKEDREKTAPETSADLISPPIIHEELDKIAFNLQLIQTEADQKIFNTLITTKDSSKESRLVGMQLSYLIKSNDNILGCISFSSAVFRCRARENWIGWNDAERNHYLNYIIRLSNFYLFPSVSNTTLKSRILEASIEALKIDFKAKYNYNLSLIETFVNPENEDINAFVNAKWVEIGSSTCKKESCIKKVLMFNIDDELKSRFIETKRKRDTEKEYIAEGPLDYTKYDFNNWAETEFGGCNLGHASRKKRLIKIANDFASAPGKGINETSDKASDSQGAYRFFENDEVKFEEILTCHYKQTVRRMLNEKVVLAVSDGSKLNYGNLTTCKGLGDIGTNQTNSISHGLQLHTTQLYTESGVPLGLVKAIIEARKFKESDKEDKKSVDENKLWVWLEGNKVLNEISKQAPETKIIHICDREADFYELFESAQESGLAVVVRAKHNRNIYTKKNNSSKEGKTSKKGKTSKEEERLSEEEKKRAKEENKLFIALEAEPKKGVIEVELGRLSARPKISGQKEKKGRTARVAKLEITWKKYKFESPKTKGETITLNAIYASEVKCPRNEEPIEWYILTNLDVNSLEDAATVIKYYLKRWKIEEYHRILKSGCEIENVQFKDIERIKRFIAIKLVIAWRIMLMLSLGRIQPNLPPETIFSDEEMEFIRCYSLGCEKRSLKTLEDAVILVACMGGYLDRKGDKEPGFQVFWRGYEKLQVLIWGENIKKHLLNDT